MPKIEISFTPENYAVYNNAEQIVIVNDIFRATSAICTAFRYGAKEVIPVASVDEALDYKEKGYLVGAERNGIKLEGFDFGNSPYSYMDQSIEDQSIVLTTTNGTRAIDIAKDAFQVVIGAFTNLSALADYVGNQERDILVLCSGWKGRYNLEDTLFGGALVKMLVDKNLLDVQSDVEDSALSAMYLYNMAKDDPYKFLMNSSHRRRLKNLNLKEDIRYCLTLDQTDIIPVLEGGKLIQLEIEKVG